MDAVNATKPRIVPRQVRPKPDPPKPESAEALYTKGIDAFRRGEPKAALASLTEASKVNPSYAPAWYGLGLVNESVGNTGAAKAAYLRYLSVAPHAANAQQIRDRVERL
jgi:Tfp pilus assembly protein PilF